MSSPNASTVSLPALAPKKAEAQEKATPGNAGKPGKPKKGENEDGSTGVEELAMPRTMIARLARSTLPPNTNLQKDALLALSKSATLFINHVASAAQEDLPPAKKTIQPANVFAALEATEFAFMVPNLKADLEKFVAIQTNKREEYKRKLKDGKTGPDGSTMLVGDEDSIADGIIQTRGADPGAQLEAESAIDRQRTAKRTKGAKGIALSAGQDEEDDDDDEDIDMLDADVADEQIDPLEDDEEEEDDDATESDGRSADEAVREDTVGTEDEAEADDNEEEEEGSEPDSD